MAKHFPEMLSVKAVKCPHCGEMLADPSMHHEERVVRRMCSKEGCDYAVDLFWFGDVATN